MSKERDPRVVAVAEKLALAYPYGFERVKNGPSGADYHAAIIAVKTLDEMAEYEYAMETTSHGIVHSVFDREWGTLEVAQERVARYTDSWKRMGRSEYVSAKLVKRRKAGKVEDV